MFGIVFFAYICEVIIKKSKPYEKVFVIIACMSLHKCGDGADKSKVRSKGIFYTPLGLSVVKGNPKATVTPGKYRLLMDVVSPTGITSFERDVVVSE